MPKVWSNDVYYHEGYDGRLNKYFRLEIVGVDDVNISDTRDYRQIPEGQVVKMEFSEQLDGYFGIYSKELKVVLDLSVPTDGNFAGMISTLGMDIATSYTLGDGESVNWTVRAGNICYLYDSDDGINWTLRFAGVQKTGIEADYNPEAEEIAVTFVEMHRVVMENVPTEIIWYAWKNENKQRRELVEFYRESTNVVRTEIPEGDTGATIYFVRWVTIRQLIQNLAVEVAKKLARRPLANIGLLSFLSLRWTFYEQKYNGTGERGAAIAENDIYTTGLYASKTSNGKPTEYAGGFLEQMKQDYKTLWDFVQDFLPSVFTRARGDVTIDNFNPTLGFWWYDLKSNSNEVSFFVTAEDGTGVVVDSFQYGGLAYQRVDASLVESTGNDIDHVEYIVPSSRSEQTLDIPVIWNIAPINEEVEKLVVPSYDFAFDGAEFPSYIVRGLRSYTFCYFAQPNNAFKAFAPFRVHEYPKFLFSDYTDTDSYIDTDWFAVGNDTTPYADPNWVTKIQTKSCSAYIVAKTLSALITLPKTSKITLKAGQVNWNIGRFVVDPTTFAPSGATGLFDNAPTKYVPQKIEFEIFGDGQIKLEGLSVS